MRICVVGLRGLPAVMGGIETHCQNLYPRVRALDPSIEIVVLTRKGHGPGLRCQHEGLTIVPLWAPKGSGAETLIHTALAVLYARFWVRADILHLHGIGPGFFSPLSRLFGLRTVVTHHGRDFERPKWGPAARIFLRCGERLSMLSAHRVICVSGALRRDLKRRFAWAARRTLMIRNAGSHEWPSGSAPADVLERFGLTANNYILAVGRLEATKGFHDLITAYLRADAHGRPLVIVGSSFQDDSYSRSLLQCGSDKVRFLRFQTGSVLRRLYEGAALFIHPSRMEGFGLVVAEALSAGRPVAVSDIPPHREFELPESAYFPPGDIEAMTRILSAPDFSQHVSAHACARVAAITWTAAARAHLDLFRELHPGSSGA
jgi:glycosyltransferase involved in cell wall biosynthesis